MLAKERRRSPSSEESSSSERDKPAISAMDAAWPTGGRARGIGVVGVSSPEEEESSSRMARVGMLSVCRKFFMLCFDAVVWLQFV